ncbi:DUF397 domain-containing protein [Streptomyces sp. NPDC003090]|uniref:DUF397 domain-containing protein n=1 Tax=Streptomyces sp. NPDC003090 TaxID=3154274 RepID=UPI003830E6B4
MVNGIIWRRSSFCGGGGNNCVEIAELPDGIGLRDSSFPEQVVVVSRPALADLLSNIRQKGKVKRP